MSFFRPIHHTFAPHATPSYCMRSLREFLKPGTWKRGKAAEGLREALGARFKGDVFLFSSGREGLVALLRSLGRVSGEEIIVQAYTCIVVPNAIHATGKVPVFADIERDTLNLDCEDAERRITSRTRAIVCQHTFGIPADGKKLRDICDRRGIALIEDCAHVLPDESGPKEIGTYGDFLLLSFGRDKAISGISGGAIVSRKPETSALLHEEEARAGDLPSLQIARLLLYPLVYAVARPLYGSGIGKFLLALARKIGALVPILGSEEKRGQMSPALHRIPNALGSLALQELKNLRSINDHRRLLADLYRSQGAIHSWPMLPGARPGLPLQKFPLFVKEADSIRRKLKSKNIHLDDGWTGCVVCPRDSVLASANYVPGSDPQAEAVSEMILSLPTHPTMSASQARELSRALNSILEGTSV